MIGCTSVLLYTPHTERNSWPMPVLNTETTPCCFRFGLGLRWMYALSARLNVQAPTRRVARSRRLARASGARGRPHAQGAAAAALLALAPGQPLAQSSAEARAAACASRAAEGRTRGAVGRASSAWQACACAKAATASTTADLTYNFSSSPATITEPAPGALATGEQPLRGVRRPAQRGDALQRRQPRGEARRPGRRRLPAL